MAPEIAGDNNENGAIIIQIRFFFNFISFPSFIVHTINMRSALVNCFTRIKIIASLPIKLHKYNAPQTLPYVYNSILLYYVYDVFIKTHAATVYRYTCAHTYSGITHACFHIIHHPQWPPRTNTST